MQPKSFWLRVLNALIQLRRSLQVWQSLPLGWLMLQLKVLGRIWPLLLVGIAPGILALPFTPIVAQQFEELLWRELNFSIGLLIGMVAAYAFAQIDSAARESSIIAMDEIPRLDSLRRKNRFARKVNPFNRGKYLESAQTWRRAAMLLVGTYLVLQTYQVMASDTVFILAPRHLIGLVTAWLTFVILASHPSSILPWADSRGWFNWLSQGVREQLVNIGSPGSPIRHFFRRTASYLAIAVFFGLAYVFGFQSRNADLMRLLALSTFGWLQVALLIYVAIMGDILRWTRRNRVPTGGLLLVAGILSGLILNQMPSAKDCRDVTMDLPRAVAPAEFRKQLKDWKDRRTGSVRENEYIIFTAEGGGIHASTRALLVLSMIQGASEVRKGDFMRHVFATSTVSGGSIGTALFAQRYDLAKKSKQLLFDDWNREARALSSRDLLAPTLGKLVYTEPFGVSVSSGLDRNRGLADAMRNAFRPTKHPNWFQDAAKTNVEGATDDKLELFESGMLSGRDGASSGLHPYYCFNSSSTQTGDQFVLTKLRIPNMRSLASITDKTNGRTDVSFVDAATLSARFPAIQSSGVVHFQPKDPLSPRRYERVIDGGLVDNSGIATAVRIAKNIIELDEDAKILFVVVGSVDQRPFVDKNFDLRPDLPSSKRNLGFGDLSSYGLAFLSSTLDKNTAETRALADLYERFPPPGTNRPSKNTAQVSLVQFDWDPEIAQIPLGWNMYRLRRGILAYQMGLDVAFEDELYKDPEELIRRSNIHHVHNVQHQLSAVLDFMDRGKLSPPKFAASPFDPPKALSSPLAPKEPARNRPPPKVDTGAFLRSKNKSNRPR